MRKELTYEIDRLRAELAAMKQDAGEIAARADTMEHSIRQLQQALVSQRGSELQEPRSSEPREA